MSCSVNKDKESFVRIPVIYHAYSQSLGVGRAEICEFACLFNCSCNAYSEGVCFGPEISCD